MPATVFYTATTLDGYIAGPDDELDWLLKYDVEDSSYPAFIQRIGAVCMGRSTYDWLQRHLEATGEPWPYKQPTWVFTTRALSAPEGADVRPVRDDVRPVHAAMTEAARGKDLWVVGGGDLAGQFHDAGLLDELIVQVAPVTLGEGKPLFPRSTAEAPFRLVSTATYGPFVEIHYRCR